MNKAAAANDAAFAFKTGFSARALIGLLGSDDFDIKVSPDGSAFYEAIRIDRNTGRPTLPQGAALGGLASDPAGRADSWIWFNATPQQPSGDSIFQALGRLSDFRPCVSCLFLFAASLIFP